MKEQSAAGILETTIEKVKNLVNVSTIIGDPMKLEGGITIIPVSKVTYGFGAGGSSFVCSTPVLLTAIRSSAVSNISTERMCRIGSLNTVMKIRRIASESRNSRAANRARGSCPPAA